MKTLLALMLRIFATLILATQLTGCITLGSTGWIAMHTTEIGQVALTAGAISAVENVVINTRTIVKEE